MSHVVMKVMLYIYLFLDGEKSVECYLCLGSSFLCCCLNSGFVVAFLLIRV